MATQTLEFSAGTGLILTCKLFVLGSDTIVASGVAAEKSNDKNRYQVAFTDIPAGTYRLNAFIGSTGGFANEVYDLALATNTFSPRSELSIDANQVLNAGDIDGYSLEEALKILLAALAGKVSGGGTTSITFRAADDSKDRITATVTAAGNRTAIILDGDG